MAVVSHLTIGVANSVATGEGAANGAGGGSTVAMPPENVRPGGANSADGRTGGVANDMVIPMPEGNATLQGNLLSVSDREERTADQRLTFVKEIWQILHSIQDEIQRKLEQKQNFRKLLEQVEKLLKYESATLDNTTFELKRRPPNPEIIMKIMQEGQLTVRVGYNTNHFGSIEWELDGLRLLYSQYDKQLALYTGEYLSDPNRQEISLKLKIGLPKVPAHPTFKDFPKPSALCLNLPEGSELDQLKRQDSGQDVQQSRARLLGEFRKPGFKVGQA